MNRASGIKKSQKCPTVSKKRKNALLAEGS